MPSRSRSNRPARAFRLFLAAATLNACATARRPASAAPGTGRASAERSVFTDSLLFRQVCTQADSGLTPAAGRCTPRNQATRIP